MDLYFVEVQTYQSVSKMGKEIGNYVYIHYHHNLVTEGGWKALVDDVKKYIDKKQKEHPRCRPMVFRDAVFEDGFHKKYHRCSLRPQAQTNDNYAFIVETKRVYGIDLNLAELIHP